MSTTNRVTTNSKNTARHAGLLIPTSDEVAAIRQPKVDAKNKKKLTKAAGIKDVAELERKHADDEDTSRVAIKPRPLVRTRSYADVMAGDNVIRTSGVEMADVETGSASEPGEDDGQATDVAESPVQSSPPRKKKRVEPKRVPKAPKPKVRDAININAAWVKKPGKKQVVMRDNAKPRKTHPKVPKLYPITEIDDGEPIAAHKVSKRDLPALTDDDESDIAPPKEGRRAKRGAKRGGARVGAKGKAQGKGEAKANPGQEIGTDQNLK